MYHMYEDLYFSYPCTQSRDRNFLGKGMRFLGTKKFFMYEDTFAKVNEESRDVEEIETVKE